MEKQQMQETRGPVELDESALEQVVGGGSLTRASEDEKESAIVFVGGYGAASYQYAI